MERLQQSGRSVSLLVSRDVEGVVEPARNHRATSIDVRPVSLKEIFLSLVMCAGGPIAAICRDRIIAVTSLAMQSISRVKPRDQSPELLAVIGGTKEVSTYPFGDFFPQSQVAFDRGMRRGPGCILWRQSCCGKLANCINPRRV